MWVPVCSSQQDFTVCNCVFFRFNENHVSAFTYVCGPIMQAEAVCDVELFCVVFVNNLLLIEAHHPLHVCTVDPSIPDTLGPEKTVLIFEVSSFQGLEMYYGLL